MTADDTQRLGSRRFSLNELIRVGAEKEMSVETQATRKREGEIVRMQDTGPEKHGMACCNDQRSTEESMKSIPYSPRRSFNPDQVTNLNIGHITEACDQIWWSGELPQWLRNFRNLQSLNASGIGLVIVEPWITELQHLQTIYLGQNQLSTWPYFLASLPYLEYICLDGNPCLEKAFLKSPTLRAHFFSLGGVTKPDRTIPEFIRGPEWPPASVARLSTNVNVNDMGFYCGGIFTLSTPPNKSNDGLLTPLEPYPLQARWSEGETNELVRRQRSTEDEIAFINRDPMRNLNGEDMRQSRILLGIFEDITILVNRMRQYFISDETQHVLLVGSQHDKINQLLVEKHDSLTPLGMAHFVGILLREENEHVKLLRSVFRKYYNCKTKSVSVSQYLRIIFEGFPAMLSIHHRFIYKELLLLAETMNDYAVNSGAVNLSGCVARLEAAFRKLRNVLELYSYQLSRGEWYLGGAFEFPRLYQDKAIEMYVHSQMIRLGCSHMGVLSNPFGGGIVSARSSIDVGTRTNAKSFPRTKGSGTPVSRPRQEDRGPVASWIDKQMREGRISPDDHPLNLLYAPLRRLVRYERFFTSFSEADARFEPVMRVCRKVRAQAALGLQSARRETRIKSLSAKFKASKAFAGYNWDALLMVKSRAYLEKGILQSNTNDVIDIIPGEPASFVKEIFAPGKNRVIRLICCENGVQIWDEVFEQLIGAVDRAKLNVSRTTPSHDPSEVRLVFTDPRETCTASVREFTGTYRTSEDHSAELVEACRFKNTAIV